jgi:hypothetical protein
LTDGAVKVASKISNIERSHETDHHEQMKYGGDEADQEQYRDELYEKVLFIFDLKLVETKKEG